MGVLGKGYFAYFRHWANLFMELISFRLPDIETASLKYFTALLKHAQSVFQCFTQGRFFARSLRREIATSEIKFSGWSQKCRYWQTDGQLHERLRPLRAHHKFALPSAFTFTLSP